MLSTRDLPAHHDLKPQKLSRRDVPHASVEVSSECNIRCRDCYNVDPPAEKSLAQIEDEIDLLLRRRRLDTISLVGGEPTIHPRIVDIVSYVKRKGLVCQILTNGVAFLQDPSNRLLSQLVQAGVDRFLVHIDDGQAHVHGDIDAARHALFARLEEQQVYFGLSLTLKRGQEASLPPLLRRFGRYRFFDGLFVTMSMDMASAFDPERSTAGDPDLWKVYRSLDRDLEVRPSAYVPSSLDDETICWLMYFHYFNVETGRTFALSPRFNRGFRAVHRWFKGREFFGATADPARFPLWLAATALAELAISPWRTAELIRLLWRGRRTRALRFHYVVVQQPPRYNSEHDRAELCYQCPDATSRDGRLTPVCVASWLSPADGAPAKAPAAALCQIYEHLGEVPPATPVRREGDSGPAPSVNGHDAAPRLHWKRTVAGKTRVSLTLQGDEAWN